MSQINIAPDLLHASAQKLHFPSEFQGRILGISVSTIRQCDNAIISLSHSRYFRFARFLRNKFFGILIAVIDNTSQNVSPGKA